MNWSLEVVVLPVGNIDRSVAFYRDQVGFQLDHDTRSEHMHVVQLTPPGSGCSIVFGDLPAQNEMQPGSMKMLQLVVSDGAAVRQELLDRGIDASELMVMAEADGGTFFGVPGPGRKLLDGAGDQSPSHKAPDPEGPHRSQRMGRSVNRRISSAGGQRAMPALADLSTGADCPRGRLLVPRLLCVARPPRMPGQRRSPRGPCTPFPAPPRKASPCRQSPWPAST